MITPADIQGAALRIDGHVRRTPVIAMEKGAFGIDAEIYLKLESLQHTGSFKPRGAFNFILSSSVPPVGVIAASGGNHGAAVAFVAQRLGIAAEIFVPTISPTNKVERLRQYGAKVNVIGDSYADALAASQQRANITGALSIHAYDDTRVLAGQGTLGMELEEQVRALDTILIAVGGGGLIGGVAAWCQGRVRVIGVEPELAPSLYKALEAQKPVDVQVSGIAADSLGARRVGELMFPIAQKHIERVVLVTDDHIREGQQTLWHKLRMVAEPGGAAALAALISGRFKPEIGERVAVVLCGGNAQLSSLGFG
ncbi:MAG TPA: threonine/serine dehydratase [Candidatus Angelobacter sp.]|jgi:threonine dehydratase|nr:threonine/serine dehydratase [Candidatus Angelobacter sp.]